MARRRRADVPGPSLLEGPGPEDSGALKRGLDVMRLITLADPAVSVEKVADELGTTESTARRLIATLVEHGFLRSSRDPNRFFADQAALTLGNAYLQSMDGLASLAATLRTFQDVEKVAVTVWVPERTEGVCVASSGFQEQMVGTRFELDRFAAGHALIWAAESPVRIALLERFTRTSPARTGARSGLLYASLHQLETEGACLSDARPGGAERAAAFPFRFSTLAPLAFSIEPMKPVPSFEARAKGLVRKLTDLASRTLSL